MALGGVVLTPRYLFYPLTALAYVALTLSVLLASVGEVGATWAAAWIHTLTGKRK